MTLIGKRILARLRQPVCVRVPTRASAGGRTGRSFGGQAEKKDSDKISNYSKYSKYSNQIPVYRPECSESIFHDNSCRYFVELDIF